MSDLLVNLLNLPDPAEQIKALAAEGIQIRRPIAPEKSLIVKWAAENFAPNWGDECDVSFSHQPVSMYVAQKENEILGFACYESTARAFFGPTGVSESARGKGIGYVLLIKCLEGLKEMGYVYAIIGSAGPVEFYKKAVGAIVIEQNGEGIYENMLKA